MTPPDGIPDDGTAVPPLDRLHQRALAGEVRAEELGRSAFAHVLRAVVRRSKRDFLLHDIDTENYAQQVLSNVMRAVGGKDASLGLFPEVTGLTAYLNTAAANQLNTVRRRRAGGTELMPDSIDAPVKGADGEEFTVDVIDVRATIDVDGIAARAAYPKARRRLPGLREEVNAGGQCLFHPWGPCPHAAAVLDLLAEVINAGGELTVEDVADRIAEVGRTLSLPANRTGAGAKRKADAPQTLSDHYHTLDRHFRRCFQWWWYRAFVGTDLDPATDRPGSRKPNEPSDPRDLLRMPIVQRLRLKHNGDKTGWQSGTSSLEVVLKLVRADEEFWRLLYMYKRDVYDYLEERTS